MQHILWDEREVHLFSVSSCHQLSLQMISLWKVTFCFCDSLYVWTLHDVNVAWFYAVHFDPTIDWLSNCSLERVYRCSLVSHQTALAQITHSYCFLLVTLVFAHVCSRHCNVISVWEGVDKSVHAELNAVLVKLTLSFNAVKICSNMITVIIADLLCHSIISQHVTEFSCSQM